MKTGIPEQLYDEMRAVNTAPFDKVPETKELLIIFGDLCISRVKKEIFDPILRMLEMNFAEHVDIDLDIALQDSFITDEMAFNMSMKEIKERVMKEYLRMPESTFIKTHEALMKSAAARHANIDAKASRHASK